MKLKSNSLFLSYSPFLNFALKTCPPHFILKSFAPDSIDLFLHSSLSFKRIGLTLCHPWWSRLYPWNGRPWPLCCTGRSSGAVPWCLQQSRHGPTYWNKSKTYMNLIWSTSLISYNLYGLSFELQCTGFSKTSLFGCMLKSASVTKRVLTWVKMQLAVLMDQFLFKLEYFFILPGIIYASGLV